MTALVKIAQIVGAREAGTARRFKQPPPRNGAPYYDAERSHWRYLPRHGGKSINIEEAAEHAIAQGKGENDPGFAGKALKRSGVLADRAAGSVASGAEQAGSVFAREQPFDISGFVSAIIIAAAGLMALVFLDMLLSDRGSVAVTRTLGALGNSVQALVDPADPLLSRTTKDPSPSPASASSSSTTKPAVQKTTTNSAPALSAGGKFFPVASASASFTDSYGAPRADTGSHYGTDIFAAKGTPVVAVESGTLSKVGWNTLGGWRLWLNGHFYYAHLNAYAPGIKEGAHVEAGQVLGYVGTTGDAKGTPPHLHFGESPDSGSDWTNPYGFLKQLWTAAKKGAAANTDNGRMV